MSIRAIRLLTVRREEIEKQKLKSDGVIKAKRDQELNTQDVSKKTNTSEAAREAKKADLDLKKAQAQLELAEKKAQSAVVGQVIGIASAVFGMASAAVKIGMKSSENKKNDKATKDQEANTVNKNNPNNPNSKNPTSPNGVSPTGTPPVVNNPEDPNKPKNPTQVNQENKNQELATVSDQTNTSPAKTNNATSPANKPSGEKSADEIKARNQQVEKIGDLSKNFLALLGGSALKAEGYGEKSDKLQDVKDGLAANSENSPKMDLLKMMAHSVTMIATGKGEQLQQEGKAIDRAINGDSKIVQEQKRTALNDAKGKEKDATGKLAKIEGETKEKLTVGDKEVTADDIKNLETVAKGGDDSLKSMDALKEKFGEEGFKALVEKTGGSVDDSGKVTLDTSTGNTKLSDMKGAATKVADAKQAVSDAKQGVAEARSSFVDSLGIKGAKSELERQKAELVEAKKANGNESVASVKESISDEKRSISGDVASAKKDITDAIDSAVTAGTMTKEDAATLKGKLDKGTLTKEEVSKVNPALAGKIDDINNGNAKIKSLDKASALIDEGKLDEAKNVLESSGSTSVKSLERLQNIEQATTNLEQANEDVSTAVKNQGALVDSILNGSFKTSDKSSVKSAQSAIEDLAQNIDKLDPSMREAALKDIKDKYGANAFSKAVDGLDKDSVEKLKAGGSLDTLAKLAGTDATTIEANSVAKVSNADNVTATKNNLGQVTVNKDDVENLKLAAGGNANALQALKDKFGEDGLKSLVEEAGGTIAKGSDGKTQVTLGTDSTKLDDLAGKKVFSTDQASKDLATLEKENPAMALQVAMQLKDEGKLQGIVDAGNKNGAFDKSSAIGSFSNGNFDSQKIANVLDHAGSEDVKAFFGKDSTVSDEMKAKIIGDLKNTNAFGVAADDLLETMKPEDAAKLLQKMDPSKAGEIINNLGNAFSGKSELKGQILAEIAKDDPAKFQAIMNGNESLKSAFNASSKPTTLGADQLYTTGDSELKSAFVAQLAKNGALVKDGQLNTELLKQTGGDSFQNMDLEKVGNELSNTKLGSEHINGLKSLNLSADDKIKLMDNMGRENSGKFLASLDTTQRNEVVSKMMASDPEKLGKILGTLGPNQAAQVLKDYRDVSKAGGADLSKVDANILKAINQTGDQGIFGIQTDSKVEGKTLGALVNMMDKSGELEGFTNNVSNKDSEAGKQFQKVFNDADLQTRTGLLKQLSKNENQTKLIAALDTGSTSLLNINRVSNTLDKMDTKDAAEIMGNLTSRGGSEGTNTAGTLLERMDNKAAFAVMENMATSNPEGLGKILGSDGGKEAFNTSWKTSDADRGRVVGALARNKDANGNVNEKSIEALSTLATKNTEGMKDALSTLSDVQIADVLSSVGGKDPAKSKELFDSLGSDTKAAVAGKLMSSGKEGTVAGLDKDITNVLKESGNDGRGAFVAAMGTEKSDKAFTLMNEALKGELSAGDVSKILEKSGGPEEAKAFLQNLVNSGNGDLAKQALSGMDNTKNKAELVNLLESDKTTEGEAFATKLGVGTDTSSKKVMENMSDSEKAALLTKLGETGFKEDELKKYGFVDKEGKLDYKAIAETLTTMEPEKAAEVLGKLDKNIGNGIGANLISNMGAKDAGKILGAMDKTDMQNLIKTGLDAGTIKASNISDIIKKSYSSEVGSAGRELSKNLIKGLKDNPELAAEVLKGTEKGIFGGDFKIASNLLAQLDPNDSAKILAKGIETGKLSEKDSAKMISGIKAEEGGQILGAMATMKDSDLAGFGDKLKGIRDGKKDTSKVGTEDEKYLTDTKGAELAAKILGKFSNNSEKSEYLLNAGAIDAEKSFLDKYKISLKDENGNVDETRMKALKDKIKEANGDMKQVKQALKDAGVEGVDTTVFDKDALSMSKTSGVQAKIIAAGINSDAFKTLFHNSLSAASNQLFDSFNNEQMRTVLKQIDNNGYGATANVSGTKSFTTTDLNGNTKTDSSSVDYKANLSSSSLAAELVRNISSSSVRESVFGGFDAKTQANMITSLREDYSKAQTKIEETFGKNSNITDEKFQSSGGIGFEVNDLSKLLGSDRNGNNVETLKLLLNSKDSALAAQVFDGIGKSWFFGIGGKAERAAIFNALGSDDTKSTSTKTSETQAESKPETKINYQDKLLSQQYSGTNTSIVNAKDLFSTSSISSSSEVTQQSQLIANLANSNNLNIDSLKKYGMADDKGNISDFQKQVIIATLAKEGNLSSFLIKDAPKDPSSKTETPKNPNVGGLLDGKISQKDLQDFATKAVSGQDDLMGLIGQSKIGSFSKTELQSLFKDSGLAEGEVGKDSFKLNDKGIKSLGEGLFKPFDRSTGNIAYIDRPTADKLANLGLASVDEKGKFTLKAEILKEAEKYGTIVDQGDLKGAKDVSTSLNKDESIVKTSGSNSVLTMAELRNSGYISDEKGKAKGDYTTKNILDRTFGGILGAGVSKSKDEYTTNENFLTRLFGDSLSRKIGQLSSEDAAKQVQVLYDGNVNKGDLAKSVLKSGSNKEVAGLLKTMDAKMAADILREGIKSGEISHSDAALVLGKLSDKDAGKILGQMALLDANDTTKVGGVSARSISGDVINKMGGGVGFLEKMGYLGTLNFDSFASSVGEGWESTFKSVSNFFTGKGDTSKGSTFAAVQQYLNNPDLIKNLSVQEKAFVESNLSGANSALLPSNLSTSGSKGYVNLSSLITNGGIASDDLVKLGLITKNKNGSYDVSKFFGNDIVDQLKSMPPSEAFNVLLALRKTSLGDKTFAKAYGEIVDDIGSDKMAEILSSAKPDITSGNTEKSMNALITNKAKILQTAVDSGGLSASSASKILATQSDSKAILTNMSTSVGRDIVSQMSAVQRASYKGLTNTNNDDISIGSLKKEDQIGGAKEKKLSNSGGSTGGVFEYAFLGLNSMMPGLQFFFEQFDKMKEAQADKEEAQKKINAAMKLRKAIMGEISRSTDAIGTQSNATTI